MLGFPPNLNEMKLNHCFLIRSAEYLGAVVFYNIGLVFS